MNPEDDPEKRIRELERPLDEQARASELGTTAQYGTHLPPPGYHGPPPPMTPWTKPAGMRMGWIVLGVLAAGLIAGAVVVFANAPGPGTRSAIRTPTPSTGPGPFPSTTSPPSYPDGTPAPRAPGPTITVSTVPAGGYISLGGVGQNKSIACNDNAVSVGGMHNTVALTGHCARVEVSGVENVVTVEAADEIVASGMNNEVTFLSGSPRIDKSGIDNSVERG